MIKGIKKFRIFCFLFLFFLSPILAFAQSETYTLNLNTFNVFVIGASLLAVLMLLVNFVQFMLTGRTRTRKLRERFSLVALLLIASGSWLVLAASDPDFFSKVSDEFKKIPSALDQPLSPIISNLLLRDRPIYTPPPRQTVIPFSPISPPTLLTQTTPKTTQPTPEETRECNDGKDNDNDNLIDYPEDPGCTDKDDNNEYNEPILPIPKAQCEDGKDNDGDGKIDYPNDPGCSSPGDDNESDDPVAQQCYGNNLAPKICDYRTVRQNGYVGFNSPPLEEYGFTNRAFTLSGGSMLAGNDVQTLEAYIAADKQDVLSNLDKFAKNNNINKNTTDIIVVHIENPFPQGRLGEFLELQGMDDFVLYAESTKMRISAVRETFPNAKLSMSATIRAFTRGDQPQAAFETRMNGYLTAASLGMYNEIDYFTPIVFITDSNKQLNYDTVGYMTEVAINYTRQLYKFVGGKKVSVPIAVGPGIVVGDATPIPPEVGLEQVEVFQNLLKPGEVIMYWFGPDLDSKLEPFLKTVMPVPSGCFCSN